MSRKTGKAIWYSYLFKNFQHIVVIHTVQGFGVDNIAEVDVVLEFACFFYEPMDIGNLIPLTFLNPAWTSGSSHSCTVDA